VSRRCAERFAARLVFDGRATITARSDYPFEARLITTAMIDGNFILLSGHGATRPAGSSHSGGRVMARKEPIVKHTDEELRAIQARGEDKSDWTGAAAMTEAEIEAGIAADPDEAGMQVNWAQASAELPQPKAVFNMRVDSDVLDFFRRQGKGYQTKINAVLRSYVEQMLHHDRR
jgi:uncharacterized protein (DUF4415 family)